MTFHFAIPGDPETKTGGYIFDAKVIAASGGEMRMLALPGGFPHPSAAELDATKDALMAADGPVLIDGLAYGAFPEAMIDALPRAPIALCHHPLGYEPGLPDDIAKRLIASERAALDKAAHIIVPSRTIQHTLISEFGQNASRVTVAPPGLDRARPARSGPGAPVILTVASLTPRKGHDTLIRALARIKQQEWTCLCAGPDDRDPETTTKLRAQITESGLAGRVHLIGPQSDAELEGLYARATVFCLPSRYEGYGMVFAEAMMRGLPVVACEAGAVADLVPRTAGRLVAVDDDKALSTCLSDLLQNPILRSSMGARGRLQALSIPGWDDTWNTISNVMRRFA